MTRFTTLLSILLIGYAAGVTIEPANPVARNGDTIQLMCRVRGVIKNCLWQINDNLYTLQDGGKYQPVGNAMDGECGIMTTISDAENGQWTCRVFVEGVVDKAQSASTNVTVYSPPVITLSPNREVLEVEAGDTVSVNCTVADARPMPAITWMLGDVELSQTSNPVAVPRSEGKFTITSSLQYAFQAGDHAKRLRCVTSGMWLTQDDDREVSTRLDVMFPPLPKDPVTLYGYGIGLSGDVVVNFTANPKPTNVYWQLDDDTRIQVEPFSPSSASGRYEITPLRPVENAVSVYEAHLKIRSVEETDAKKTFVLVVESEMRSEQLQEYVVRISTSPTPVPTGSLSGGGIAAIIIIVLAIAVVGGLVLFARNTGRWCFSGGRRTVGEGESQARIDEEAPGEIVKEKEGKEGPLKGSNENLNLQLATANGQQTDASLENNGNGVPVKEPITQNGTPADGKDTAV